MVTAGMSVKDVAEKLGVKKRTVGKWLKRYKDGGGLEIKQRQGRPRSTTVAQDELIANLYSVTPDCSSKVRLSIKCKLIIVY